MKIMGPKDPEESKVLAFEFDQDIASTDSIVSAVVTASVHAGTDPTASTLVSGAATFSGTTVYQRVSGGVSGVTYKLRAKATDSAGNVHILVAGLHVGWA